MKIILRYIFGISVILGALGAFLIPRGYASAVEYKAGEEVILEEGEIIEDDYLVSGGRVEIHGTVDGDLIVMGGQVLVKGEIQRDLIVLGGNVDIDGNVSDDIIAIGGEISIRGNVRDNVSVAGGSLEIDNDSVIGGDLTTGCGALMLRGKVMKRLRSACGAVMVSGTVDGLVEIHADQVSLSNGSHIGGDFTYWSNKDAEVDDGVIVVGETTKNFVEAPTKFSVQDIFNYDASSGFIIWTLIIKIIGIIIVGMIFFKLFPYKAKHVYQYISKRPWHALRLGALVAFAVPIVSIIIMFTMIGAPLAMIVMGLLMIMMYIAKVIFAYYIGEKVVNLFESSDEEDGETDKKDPKKAHAWHIVLSMIVGGIIIGFIGLLKFIPVIGWLFAFIILGIGKLFFLGGLLRFDFRLWKRLREQEYL